MKTSKGYGLGWIPDIPDHRDKHHSDFGFCTTDVQLPVRVDLVPKMPPIWNQGQEGSCTAFSTCGAAAYSVLYNKQKILDPSQQFVYYNGRALEGTTSSDSGCQIRDVVKSIAKYGVCQSKTWPYSYPYTHQPSKQAYAEGSTHKALQYGSVTQDEKDIKTVLANNFPVVFGATLYESFESDRVASTGKVPMPGKNESAIGGHAILIVGYDDSSKEFIVRNSWGTDWGMSGYCTFPYAYVLNSSLCDDFWVIKLIKD